MSDLPGVAAYMDDIIVTGKTWEEHVTNLNLVLQRLTKSGLTCKREKCHHFQTQVNYLGHIIDKNGIRPFRENLEAILKLPAPKDVSQLMAFLGKADFYRKFVPMFSNVSKPLNNLRRASQQFQWTKVEDNAFRQVKQSIANATTLTHYDPNKTLLLATDASSVGMVRLYHIVKPMAMSYR